MKLLRGKKIASRILTDLVRKIKAAKVQPGLAVVLVGQNKASETYVRLKEKAAKKVGICFQVHKFSEKTKEADIIKKIKVLNLNDRVSGIIVQLPLPAKFQSQRIINTIAVQKDADGFHPENLKLFQQNKGRIEPVFPKAIGKLLESIPAIRNAGKRTRRRLQAVIVAKSDNFGKIMRAALRARGIAAEYYLVEEIKNNLAAIKKADIIISAVGKAGIINGIMVKKGAVIIDGGIIKKGQKVVGDVDRDSVKNVASYLSPVPGGVGPVTVACLLENVYFLAKKSR